MSSKFNEALSFFKNGNLNDSKEICLKVLKDEPKNFNFLHLLGAITFEEKDYIKSEKIISEVSRLKPQAEVFQLYALILFKLKKFDLALRSWDDVIKLKPNNAEAYNNKGNILFLLEKYEASIESFKEAIKIKPDYADAYNNLGNPLWKQKKIDESLLSYKKAIEINPNHPEAHNNLGMGLHKLKKYETAFQSYENAIRIKPDYAEAHYNKGNLLFELEKIDKSLESYDTAINLNPNYAEAYFNKGIVLLAANVNDEALENFKKVLNIKPEFENLPGTIIYTKLKLCDWKNFDEDFKNFKKAVLDPKKSVNPHNLLFTYDSLKAQISVAKKWSDKLISFNLGDNETLNFNNLNKSYKSDKKIKIGYFSADFRKHAVGNLVVNLFELHDKSKFEIYCFYFGPDTNDEIYQRISNTVYKFINVRSKSEKEIAQLSRDLKIDISIDLMGYTIKNRSKIFIEKCAPLQVSYLGYPGTTGANYIDYIIADKIVIPKENQEFYSEKIIYLPNSFMLNDSTKKISRKIFSKEELGLPSNGFIFCCFNQSYKILPETFDIWMKILKRVEDSVLWLFKSNEACCKNLKQEASHRGIDPKRIIFANRLPSFEEHLARYKVADLFLDTSPYNAHSTCCDSLKAGLPVLTLQGETYSSRVSSSLLNVLDLKELIIKSKKKYEEKAVELANDLSVLKNIKKKLDHTKNSVSLFNTKLLTNHIEKGYLEIYKKYCDNKKPENIELK